MELLWQLRSKTSEMNTIESETTAWPGMNESKRTNLCHLMTLGRSSVFNERKTYRTIELINDNVLSPMTLATSLINKSPIKGKLILEFHLSVFDFATLCVFNCRIISS